MFSYFIKKYNPSIVISYADARWSDGNVYRQLGMELSHLTKSGYWYVNHRKNTREHRFNYTKQALVKQGFDPLMTEKEIMIARGYDTIWDCGNYKYIWTKK